MASPVAAKALCLRESHWFQSFQKFQWLQTF
jgi:hypothetical protein